MPSIRLLCFDILSVKGAKLGVGLLCFDIMIVKSSQSSLVKYVSFHSHFTYRFSSTDGAFIPVTNLFCSLSSLLSAILTLCINLFAYLYAVSLFYFILHNFCCLHFFVFVFACLLCYIQFL